MRDILFQFQEDALSKLHARIKNAHTMWAADNPQVISFSAPTGAGKTVIATALFKDILYGSPECDAEPDSVIIWLSDSPALNEQSRMKIESKKRGFKYVGAVTIYSHLQACGIINDHDKDCPCYQRIVSEYPTVNKRRDHEVK